MAYGSQISIGDNFYANFNLVVVDDGKVIIGNNVMIAPNVTISTTGHPIDPAVRITGQQFSQTVTLEDNVWIGSGAIIHQTPPERWFRSDEGFDEQIRHRLSAVHQAALRGELAEWRESLSGRLAEIIGHLCIRNRQSFMILRSRSISATRAHVHSEQKPSTSG